MSIQSDLNKQLIEDVVSIYTSMEEELLEKIANQVKKGLSTDTYLTKMADVQALKQQAMKLQSSKSKLWESKISDSLINAYSKGVISANKDLGHAGSIMKDVMTFRAQRLILETKGLVSGTSVQILRDVEDAYRSITSEVSMEILMGMKTRQQAAQDALNRYAAKGITSFIDKGGRKWEMASYVEMALRTTTARAAVQGHLDRQTELGEDLIKISSIGTTCPICAPWQGKVLSISGNSLKYPSLESAKAAKLFHPNCRHTIMAYNESLAAAGLELSSPDLPTKPNDPIQYQAQQHQRHLERQVRKWKRVEAVALDPVAQMKAHRKVLQYQKAVRAHTAQYGLTRKYYRESIRSRIGDPTKGQKQPLIKPLTKDDKAIKKANKVQPQPISKPVVQPKPQVTPPIAPTPTKPVWKNESIHLPDDVGQYMNLNENTNKSLMKMQMMHFEDLDPIEFNLGASGKKQLDAAQDLYKKLGTDFDEFALLTKTAPKVLSTAIEDLAFGDSPSYVFKGVYDDLKYAIAKYDISSLPNAAQYIDMVNTFEAIIEEYGKKYPSIVPDAIPGKIYLHGVKKKVKLDITVQKLTPVPKPTPAPAAPKKVTKVQGPTTSSVFKVVEDLDAYESMHNDWKYDYGNGVYGKKSRYKKVKFDTTVLADSSQDTADLKKYLARYSGDSYDDINTAMRRGNKSNLNPLDLKIVDEIENLIRRHETPFDFDTKFYRHTGGSDLKYNFVINGVGDQNFGSEIYQLFNEIHNERSPSRRKNLLDKLTNKVQGTSFVEKSIVSTSMRNDQFLKQNGLEIEYIAPKGRKSGIAIESISQFPHEAEIIIPPNETFKIVGVDYVSRNGATQVSLKVMHADVADEYIAKALPHIKK